jgi:hypothetical protein
MGNALAYASAPLAPGHALRASTAWSFTRYGIVVTIATTAMAWVYVYLRYFA